MKIVVPILDLYKLGDGAANVNTTSAHNVYEYPALFSLPLHTMFMNTSTVQLTSPHDAYKYQSCSVHLSTGWL